MASANTANGMIHATMLKPLSVGADSTVLPYFCTKLCKMSESLSPRSRPAVSSLRMRSEYAQPTWLHSSKNLVAAAHAHHLVAELVEAGIDVSAHERDGHDRDQHQLHDAKFRVLVSSFKVFTYQYS